MNYGKEQIQKSSKKIKIGTLSARIETSAKKKDLRESTEPSPRMLKKYTYNKIILWINKINI
jgi:hypothetical protein